jgi:hypothetical protein
MDLPRTICQAAPLQHEMYLVGHLGRTEAEVSCSMAPRTLRSCPLCCTLPAHPFSLQVTWLVIQCEDRPGLLAEVANVIARHQHNITVGAAQRSMAQRALWWAVGRLSASGTGGAWVPLGQPSPCRCSVPLGGKTSSFALVRAGAECSVVWLVFYSYFWNHPVRRRTAAALTLRPACL